MTVFSVFARIKITEVLPADTVLQNSNEKQKRRGRGRNGLRKTLNNRSRNGVAPEVVTHEEAREPTPDPEVLVKEEVEVEEKSPYTIVRPPHKVRLSRLRKLGQHVERCAMLRAGARGGSGQHEGTRLREHDGSESAVQRDRADDPRDHDGESRVQVSTSARYTHSVHIAHLVPPQRRSRLHDRESASSHQQPRLPQRARGKPLLERRPRRSSRPRGRKCA